MFLLLKMQNLSNFIKMFQVLILNFYKIIPFFVKSKFAKIRYFTIYLPSKICQSDGIFL